MGQSVHRPRTEPAVVWSGLDAAWQEAFNQAWEALRSGCIPVGACVTTRDGDLVRSSRNRLYDTAAPPGEVFGSALAHAEINALARLELGRYRDLVLTTTLEPCLQCAAAIRLSAVTTVRFAGPDRYWDGCHDFSKLSDREAARPQSARLGPLADELGTFGTLISRLGPPLSDGFAKWLRSDGEGDLLDLASRLNASELDRLREMSVADAFVWLWPELEALSHAG